jgi:SAM-dependent MidA family methyltransferase
VAAEVHHPAFFAALRYRIVEPFAVLHHRQLKTLAAFCERLLWCDSLERLEPFCGVHFSNELLDAMPVHLIRWAGREWLERYVDYRDKRFVFVDRPVAEPALRDHVARILAPDFIGYETEVNLASAEWIRAVEEKLASGFVLAVDYGFARDEFYAPHRTSGTLQCRAQHRVLCSPFEQIGEADITAHVEWTSVVEAAERSALRLMGFTDQHHFITGLLVGEDGARIVEEQEPEIQRALQTLLHPGLLGMKFQYLVLAKGVAATSALSGLRFAHDDRATLIPSS